jgi:hypothetical protein
MAGPTSLRIPVGVSRGGKTLFPARSPDVLVSGDSGREALGPALCPDRASSIGSAARTASATEDTPTFGAVRNRTVTVAAVRLRRGLSHETLHLL